MKRKTDKAKEKDAEKVKDKDNEKVKEKDKPVERRSTRRSSRRHSKRRKKSSSPSPERDESGNEDNNVPLKSPVVETEPKVEPTVKSSEKIESGGIQSRLRRSRQRQEVVEASSSKEEKPKECSDEWQEDTSFWEESNSKVFIAFSYLLKYFLAICNLFVKVFVIKTVLLFQMNLSVLLSRSLF